MTIDQMILGLGLLATWFTAYLVLRTLREMEKQRKASLRPDLIIPPMPIYAYTREDSVLPIAKIWSDHTIGPQISTKDLWFGWPEVTLFNIGFGAAKDIQLRWVFGIEDVLKGMTAYLYEKALPVVVTIEDGHLIINVQGTISSWSDVEMWSNSQHDYLMPASVMKEGIKSQVPVPYLELIAVQNYMTMIELGKGPGQTGDLNGPPFQAPPLSLQLSYSDVEGESYRKNFEVTYRPMSGMFPPGPATGTREEIIHASLQFTEHKASRNRP
jgi:hypothetical protein